MTAIARMLSPVSYSQPEIETLGTIAVFCGIGLVVSLLLITRGLDMSAGFF